MWLVQLLFDELDTCVWPCCYNFEHKVSFILNSNHSLLNLKLFVLLKNCQCKSEIIELASTIVWNRSAIKFAELNLGYDGKMVDHISNSTFVLKLVSRSFRVSHCFRGWSKKNLEVYDIINSLNKKLMTNFVWYLGKGKRNDIETLSIEHFYGKIMQKMCTNS